MKDKKVEVALYDNHGEAEEAVKKLQKVGYDMKMLSIVGKDYQTDENVVGYYNIGDRMKKWGGIGVFWGSIWGILLGSGFFFIPGIGPILIAGPFVTALIGALEGAITFGGLSVLGAALASLGIPKDSILEYETEIKAGKFMLLVHGTPAEGEKAKGILRIADQLLV
jgi:uncharacterized membrane protein